MFASIYSFHSISLFYYYSKTQKPVSICCLQFNSFYCPLSLFQSVCLYHHSTELLLSVSLMTFTWLITPMVNSQTSSSWSVGSITHSGWFPPHYFSWPQNFIITISLKTFLVSDKSSSYLQASKHWSTLGLSHWVSSHNLYSFSG